MKLLNEILDAVVLWIRETVETDMAYCFLRHGGEVSLFYWIDKGGFRKNNKKAYHSLSKFLWEVKRRYLSKMENDDKIGVILELNVGEVTVTVDTYGSVVTTKHGGKEASCEFSPEYAKKIFEADRANWEAYSAVCAKNRAEAE
jgi:hypothetical protein